MGASAERLANLVFPASLALIPIHSVIIFFLFAQWSSEKAGAPPSWEPYYHWFLVMKWAFTLVIIAFSLSVIHVLTVSMFEYCKLPAWAGMLPLLATFFLLGEIIVLTIGVFWIGHRVKKEVKELRKRLSRDVP